MAKTIVVRPGQSLPDIAVQYGGDQEAWATIAALNGLALTADLVAGQVLIIPDVAPDKRTAAIFKLGRFFPASGEVVPYGSGIGYWGIEFDFYVS